MDQVEPLPSQNGLPNLDHLPPDFELMEDHDSSDAVKENQLKDENKEPQFSNGGSPPDDEPSKSPARGLELIYKVAEELATRIADEKRYEGIIRPCSVKVLRISDVSQYRIIRDETLIINESTEKKKKEEVTIKQELDEPFEDIQIEDTADCSDSSDDEEIILPPEDESKDESLEEKFTFACIFCPEKNLQGKSMASDHYQSHLDYFPYKCSQCLEVTTNLKNLFLHYRKDHSEEKTATYKKKLIPWINEWIDNFLKSQISAHTRKRNTVPRPYCPVCDIIWKKEEIILLPPNLIKPRKQMMHIHKHLLYEPYICLICQKVGEKFTANDYDDRVYEHILRNHPEAEDKSLKQVFQRSRQIKPLENYIIHYLTLAGVSTKTRVPEKIPNFVRNKFKLKLDGKEKEKTDKDNNRTPTLDIGLLNQSSINLPDHHLSTVSTIGQNVDNHNNLSNQTTISQTTITPYRINPTLPTLSTFHKPNNMLTSSNLSILPSKGPSPQLASFNVNGVPNVYTVSTISLLPKNPSINGVTSQHQPILHPAYQQPKFIQLPCGQIMVRASPPTPAQSSPELSPSKQANYGKSILRTTPAILRRPSITSPPRESNQNGPLEIQTCPDISSFVASDVIIKRKQEDEFVKRNYFCMFCKETVHFESFIDGLFHFSNHLEYNPVNCLLCCEKFPDMDSIMKHFVEVHSHVKVCQDRVECEQLLYFINREGHTEKWLEQYLYFQVSGELERLANVDNSFYCTICKSVLNKNVRFPTRSSNKKPALMTPSLEVVRHHLNLHINYRPYECYLCSKIGYQIKFASVGETALKHLKTHGFTPVDKNFIKEFFDYKPIQGLENFIKNYLISEYYPNSFGSRENINSKPISQQPVTMNGVNNHKTYLKSSGDNIPKRLFTDMDHTYGSISSSPLSTSSSPNLKKFTVFACYHCKLTINGIQELIVHCKTNHPNLSIASYCLPTINGIN